MTTLILDGVTYAAFCDAFHDVPEGKSVNRGHVAVQLEDDEIEALQSEQRDGETLSQTIMRVSDEVRKAQKYEPDFSVAQLSFDTAKVLEHRFDAAAAEFLEALGEEGK
ncbi:MAG: hypothetical protein KGP14_13360 [Betaproteobacteria bacterium]|nr:hypothetical protein [Betaproteobacteria bacterium]